MSEAATITLDPVQAAIAAATAAAKEAVLAQANAVTTNLAPAANTNLAPAAMPQRGVPMTTADMQSSLVVDGWLGVKEHGLLVGTGTGKELHQDPIHVLIDLRHVQPCEAVKFGNPAQYYKTYDRVTEARGGAWVDALMKAQRMDPKARAYPSADIPMKLTQPVKIKDKVIHEAGQTLGNSLSTTNWANWVKFWRECQEKSLTGGEVAVVVSHEKRTNAAGNVWGVLTFTLAS